MNTDYLIDEVRTEIRSTHATNVANSILNVLERENVDLHREPSLEEMKRIVVEASRDANECRCTRCPTDISAIKS